MSRDSNHSPRGARVLVTWTLAAALGLAAGALAAQPETGSTAAAIAAPTAEAANAPAPAAESRREARERRRAEEAAVDSAQEASATIASLAAEAAAVGVPTAESVEVDSAPVCKNIKVSGTKISRRICMTPEDMAARERAAEQFKRDIEQRTGIVGVAPPNPLAPSN